MGEYYEASLRDFGLLIGALALAVLASGRTTSGSFWEYARRPIQTSGIAASPPLPAGPPPDE